MSCVASHFILYVSDQKRSAEFWRCLLAMEPVLDVPGMTEFRLGKSCILGLMPSAGIRRLLGESIRDPEEARGIPRSEVYLRVRDPEVALRRAESLRARVLSPFLPRDWGMSAGYIEDPDGHVIAFST